MEETAQMPEKVENKNTEEADGPAEIRETVKGQKRDREGQRGGDSSRNEMKHDGKRR